jgi:uncharacterized cofD-like protein
MLKGLKKYPLHFSVITSMADDGGSSGRLREAYNIMPPGDVVNCIASLIPDTQKDLAELLLYRFPGENNDPKAIDGHKLGNLIMLAEIQRTGDFHKAVAVTKQMFGVTADLLPATDERVQLGAITNDGRTVHSETTLDLALYSEPHGLQKIFITPEQPTVNEAVVQSILNADVVISGPGDLYTNQLPVLVVPQIKKAMIETKAKKIFIINIANKPFETKGYSVDDFIQAVIDHMGTFPFDKVLINSNTTPAIPEHYHYTYVSVPEQSSFSQYFALSDLVNTDFPLYHDPEKLAKQVMEHI